MTTALALIRRSLRLIRAIDPGENMDAAEAQDGLESLNAMLGSWRLEGLMAWAIERVVFSMTAGTQVYSLGPGATWSTTALFGANATRPVAIEAMGLIDTTTDPDLEVPMTPMTNAEYQALGQKALTSTWPTRWQYSPSVPLGSVFLWPSPTVNRSAAVYLRRQLHSFATVQTNVTLPEGYEDALVYNLAIRLSSEYGVSVGGEIVAVAQETKALIKRQHKEQAVLQLDPLAPGQRQTGRLNYITDTYE